MNKRQVAELAALFIVGDGVLTATGPQRHLALWSGGPRWYRNFAEALRKRPNTTRCLGIAAVALGIFWASWQKAGNIQDVPS